MRAAQTPPRNVVFARRNISAGYPALRKPVSPQTTGWIGSFISCSAAFLMGYLPGLLVGRNAKSDFGQQLAAYYADTLRFSDWSQVLLSRISASFLQLLAVILCGFFVFGSVCIILSFAARGIYLGFCAASLLTYAGTRTLVLYWLMDCLPGLAVLFVSLRLAYYAVQLSNGLFQSVFWGGAPRGQLGGAVRRLLVRGGAAFLLCCLFSVVFSGLDVFFARLLLG